MINLNLNTTTKEQELIKQYLEENVSETLANRINNGVKIVKNNKTLINKKDLNGFMNYANQEARKLAEKGSNCACIEDTSIKSHLEEMEKQKEELEAKLVIEKTRVKMMITEDDIIAHLKTAPKKKPKQMIDMLVKEIKLYNDKIEIYFKYNKSTKNADTENLQIYDKTEQINVYNNPNPVDIQIKGIV